MVVEFIGIRVVGIRRHGELLEHIRENGFVVSFQAVFVDIEKNRAIRGQIELTRIGLDVFADEQMGDLFHDRKIFFHVGLGHVGITSKQIELQRDLELDRSF